MSQNVFEFFKNILITKKKEDWVKLIRFISREMVLD